MCPQNISFSFHSEASVSVCRCAESLIQLWHWLRQRKTINTVFSQHLVFPRDVPSEETSLGDCALKVVFPKCEF